MHLFLIAYIFFPSCCCYRQASDKDAWNAEEEEGALKSERGGSWVGPASFLVV